MIGAFAVQGARSQARRAAVSDEESTVLIDIVLVVLLNQVHCCGRVAIESD
jgi:hypothetical protein